MELPDYAYSGSYGLVTGNYTSACTSISIWRCRYCGYECQAVTNGTMSCPVCDMGNAANKLKNIKSMSDVSISSLLGRWLSQSLSGSMWGSLVTK